MKRQKDLGYTNPYVQDLLKLPKASNKAENFIKIHFFESFYRHSLKCAALLCITSDVRGPTELLNVAAKDAEADED